MTAEEPELIDEPLGPDVGDGSEARPALLVEVWLAVPSPAGWRALMLLRSEARGAFWQGVSGRVEPDDGSLRRAALRELGEELGLEPPLHARIELLDLGRWYEFRSSFSDRWYRKRSLGARLPAGVDPARVTLSEEHVEVRCTTFDEAVALVRWPENETELRALQARLERDQRPMRPRE